MITRQADLLQAAVLADVGLVLISGAALLRVSRLVRQPAVIGEIVAGIALGPSVLGLLPGDLTTRLFPLEGRPYLAAIAQIGLLLFMFVLGWELEPERLGRARGSVAMLTFGSMTLPFVLGLGAAALLYRRHSTVAGHHVTFSVFGVYLGISMSITAFPVLARILTDRGLAATRIGTLTLASAAVGDVLAWCLLAVVIAVVTASGPGAVATTAGGVVVYVVILAVVVRPLLGRAATRIGGLSGPGGMRLHVAGLVAAGIFLSSYATTRIGIHPIFGAFAFGIVMPREPRAELQQYMLRPFQATSTLLMPVYFIVTGLSVDIGGLHPRDWADLALLVVCACLGKVIGGTVPARSMGLPWREALSVGVLMNVRGLTELIILNIGLSLGVLDVRLFTMMVLVALVTTALAGPVLPFLVPAPEAAEPQPIAADFGVPDPFGDIAPAGQAVGGL